MKTTIVIDMYGVILTERSGNFMQYIYDNLKESLHPHINKIINEDKLFTKAGYGEICSHDFLLALGFDDPDFHMKRYIQNYLTLDVGFTAFAEKYWRQYDFVLLSTDVSEWSKYITEYYGLNKYFKYKIISGDVHLRKPDPRIYDLMLKRIGRQGSECYFVDDSAENLAAAQKFGIIPIHFKRYDGEFNQLAVHSFAELDELIERMYNDTRN